MRFDKLTIKSQELIQNAQSLASAHNHQQIEPEHILSAMLNEPQGIARSMLDKLGVSGDDVFRELAAAIDRIPKVSGSAVGMLTYLPGPMGFLMQHLQKLPK